MIEPSDQDRMVALIQQRDAAANKCVELYAQLRALERRIAELEKQEPINAE